MKAAAFAEVDLDDTGQRHGAEPLDGEVIECGDDRVLSFLYQEVGKSAALKAGRITGRMDVALELVQDVFLKLWKSRLTFPNRKAAFVWIYRSVHNAAIDHLRLACNKITSTEQHQIDELTVMPDTSIEDRQLILTATRCLTERELQILFYHLVDEMTQGEIADVLQVSRKTIVRECRKIEEKLTAYKRGVQ